MNYALIFAGGVGKRMGKTKRPKQFIEIFGKPVIIYTIKLFQECKSVDKIFISCIEEYIPFLWKWIRRENLSKVVKIVVGGKTGQESIYNGLLAIDGDAKDDDIVLIHDAVRPNISNALIEKNIEYVKKFGNCVSCSQSVETIVITNDNKITKALERSNSYIAKAPQSFYLRDILRAHQKAISEGKNGFIDSASIMKHYGHDLYFCVCDSNNIKITTEPDLILLKHFLRK